MEPGPASLHRNPPTFGWKRSSRCDSGTCVEANLAEADVVYVRDSKLDDSPLLRVSAEAWRAFTSGLKAGDIRR